jgi:FkbM family methyltransferase
MASWRSVFGTMLTPAARAWIRYSPLPAGKSWLWEKFHWRPRTFTCRTRFGGRVTGNTEDLIQCYLYYFGTWEPHISWWIASNLRPGDGFIDVGANIGHYSLLASPLVGDSGTVVAIEAAHDIHAILDQHVALNRRRNIRTVQVAAAEAKGTARLFHGKPGNIGKTTTIARDGESCEVPALPLAEILTADEIRRTRIIKIDVEGAELQVLRGLAPLLPQLRADVEVVMEISPNLMPEADRARDEILATMRENGFSAFVLENEYDGIESYLRPPESRQPLSLTNFKFMAQTDILFSRSRQKVTERATGQSDDAQPIPVV